MNILTFGGKVEQKTPTGGSFGGGTPENEYSVTERTMAAVLLEDDRLMRTVAWIALAFALIGFDLWIVFGPTVTQNPLLIGLIMLAFVVPNIGAFWMLYMVVRNEKQPFPMLLLALLVPGASLWYYFERVRPGRVRGGNVVRDNSD